MGVRAFAQCGVDLRKNTSRISGEIVVSEAQDSPSMGKQVSVAMAILLRDLWFGVHCAVHLDNDAMRQASEVDDPPANTSLPAELCA